MSVDATRRHGACPSLNQLNSYLNANAETNSELTELEQHIESCSECSHEISKLAMEIDVEPFRSFIDGQRHAPVGQSQSDESTALDRADSALDQEFLNRLLEVPALAKRTHVAALSDNEFDFPEAIGDYSIAAVIKQGVTTVYLALNTNTHRECIVTVLPTFAAPVITDQIRSQLAELAEIKQANLVEILEVTEHAPSIDARPVGGNRHTETSVVVVTEFLQAVSLSERIRSDGPLSSVDACRVIREAAVGMQAVHAHQISHGQLGPSTLFLTDDNDVKIGNFESYRVDNPNNQEFNARGDVQALGETLAYLLTNQRRSTGESWSELIEVYQHNARSESSTKSQIPAELLGAIDKMIGENCRSPYETMDAVIEALTPRLDLAGP